MTGAEQVDRSLGVMGTPSSLGFYDFFSGGGMARLGLGAAWQCLFANDNSGKKNRAYRGFFGPSPELSPEDVQKLSAVDLPGRADLAWASFPCQDLSLAGNGAGLAGRRSGSFWAFRDLVSGLRMEGRAPPILVLENVTGALSSHGGNDFAAIVRALQADGFRTGAFVGDALLFLPQSRPRLFVVAVDFGVDPPHELTQGTSGGDVWLSPRIRRAYAALPDRLQEGWVWWRIPRPPARRVRLLDVIEETPTGVSWDSPEKTSHLLSLMAPIHLGRVRSASSRGQRVIGCVYRRTRKEDGRRQQRAEVRFDGVAGCLRTPAGGSSRQILLDVQGSNVRSRLLSPREAARLMGLPDSYPLPVNYNEAYHLVGDGVAVPLVSWIERHLLRPLALSARLQRIQEIAHAQAIPS